MKKLQTRERVLPVIIFLFSLFLIMGITVPGLQINDEWITANQLHQMVQGHQVLMNEGKYGSTPGGDISGYFKYRGNILGYSLFLPILAAVPLFLLMMFGEHFRFGIIFFWSLIPVILAFIIHAYLPEYCRVRNFPILIPAMSLSAMLLVLNVFFYYPFPSEFLTDPLESGALAITANILFGILCTILFLIGLEIFHDRRKALFAMVALFACSSYLYWGTSGKDHMLSLVLFTVSLLLLCKYFRNNSRSFAGLCFFFLGLTAWVRPELGLTEFLSIGLFFLFISLIHLNNWNLRNYLSQIFPICFFFIGLLPFCFNNYILTGNPLYSPFFKYMPSEDTGTITEIINQNISSVSTIPSTPISSGFSIQHLISLFFKQYTLNSPSLLEDLKGILFFADNGSMPIVALTPLFIIGILSIPIFLQRKEIPETDFNIFCLCVFAIMGVFIAYMRSMHGLHTSEGIAPDIRYLAPMYVPGGIIGLIGMKYWKYCPIDSNMWKKSIVAIFFGSPLYLIVLLILQPFGGGFFYFNYTISLCSFGLLFLLICQFSVMELFGKWNSYIMRGNLILLLIVSVTWQLMMVFLFSMAKFDGYSFWIPMSEIILYSFIVPVT